MCLQRGEPAEPAVASAQAAKPPAKPGKDETGDSDTREDGWCWQQALFAITLRRAFGPYLCQIVLDMLEAWGRTAPAVAGS